MARPLRLEYAGALYHLTSRGDGREDIYLSNSDRELFLDVLAGVCKRFNWVCHSYCMMDNHYHLLVETPDANLSQGMRHLNGVYTQRFNREHNRVGHVFQGRYKAILVEKESYLLELARYIVLNPVRATMVKAAKDWPWSSYRATAGQIKPPTWLTVDWILSNFGTRKAKAIDSYKKFVAAGKNQVTPWERLKNQIYIGSDRFIKRLQAKLDSEKDLSEIPRAQQRPISKPFSYYENKAADRNHAIQQAYDSGGYSMKEIGDYFGLHYSWVSRIVNKAKSKT